MNTIIHERPGVYSVYDASGVTPGGRAPRAIGLAARASQGEAGKAVTVTGSAAGTAVFGDEGDLPALLELLFAGGASSVTAVRVADPGTLEDYRAAFAALDREDVQLLLCDSTAEEVQQALKEAAESASAARRERIALAGCEAEASVEDLLERAKALNCERVVLAGPGVLDRSGKTLSGAYAAAAVAALAASVQDPALPIHGGTLPGLGGLTQDYTDGDIDRLVRGGVTPLESVGGTVSPVRAVTTRTSTGGSPDASWRELTTIFIVDDVIPAVRRALRNKFARSKNTPRSRAAIRSQVIVELERKLAEEIISGYSGVTVTPSEEDPTVCLVEFGFSVAHGLNQVRLTVHIEI